MEFHFQEEKLNLTVKNQEAKSFIDNFEEQLVGYTKGQEGEITVKFPEEYHAPELAGKPAQFKVKINAIKQLREPQLNDEFAKELGYESLEDLKNKTKEETIKKEKMTEQKMNMLELLQIN